MKTLLILLVVIALGTPCHARLGETPEQCVERYGPMIGRDDASDSYGFSKDGIMILIHFTSGTADSIAFGKPGEKLSDAQIQVLLTAEGSGLKWSLLANNTAERAWVREDKAVVAYIGTDGHLFIMTEDAVKRSDAVKSKGF